MNKEKELIFYVSLTFFLIGALYGFIIKSITINKYDVNNDGIVDSKDYVEIKKYIMNN